MTRLKSRIERLEATTRSRRQEPRRVFLVTEDGLAAGEEDLQREGLFPDDDRLPSIIVLTGPSGRTEARSLLNSGSA